MVSLLEELLEKNNIQSIHLILISLLSFILCPDNFIDNLGMVVIYGQLTYMYSFFNTMSFNST